MRGAVYEELNMPIRLLTKNQKPFAYTWGYHGAIYTVNKYGITGAKKKAQRQAAAAYVHGYQGSSNKLKVRRWMEVKPKEFIEEVYAEPYTERDPIDKLQLAAITDPYIIDRKTKKVFKPFYNYEDAPIRPEVPSEFKNVAALRRLKRDKDKSVMITTAGDVFVDDPDTQLLAWKFITGKKRYKK